MSRTYYSFDIVEDENKNCYEDEFFDTLSPNGLSQHKLQLKVNCPITLLRNMNPSIGLCNGTRMVCKRFDKNVIYVKITTRQHAGENYPFKFIRK